ncbi:hypothetical protein NQ315_014216 [Exocentrus adspersus]|uniref:Uncharacterized protein n=1 Tax=Exocentrus adspersus TaxID=1586481 RepID=A0AAV8V9G6_9CUCU|nr:hypothetical protein NQ315_014216 [Exocentrus adspersus]
MHSLSQLIVHHNTAILFSVKLVAKHFAVPTHQYIEVVPNAPQKQLKQFNRLRSQSNDPHSSRSNSDEDYRQISSPRLYPSANSRGIKVAPNVPQKQLKQFSRSQTNSPQSCRSDSDELSQNTFKVYRTSHKYKQ